MGKLTIFAIVLNQDVVSSGSVIEGRVVVELIEPMKMRGIHVAISGSSRVQFFDYIHKGGERERTRFRASEHYYGDSRVLFGKAKGDMFGDNPSLPAGHWEYPFQFVLPADLPPSVEMKYGYIRHQIKATIDKPWKIDHVVKRPFTVLGLLDLNYRPPTPISHQKEKTLGCLCCAAGEISMDIKLPRTGYVPGEYIIFNGLMTNGSSRKIDSYSFRIKQIVVYRATRPRHKHETKMNVVAEVKHKEGIEPGQTVSLETEALLIPPLPPSELGACTTINISYLLQIEMNPSGASMDLDYDIPLTIGTIPPMNMGVVFASGPYNPDWYNPNVDVRFPPPGSFTAAPLPAPPPPTYMMSMMADTASECGSDSEDEDKGKLMHGCGGDPWAPSYSYYTWN